MYKSENGNPVRCAENLMNIVRGEVPYDRVRGIDGSIIDQPIDDAEILLEQDAKWNIGTYEPRVDASGMSVNPAVNGGSYTVTVDVVETEETEE